MTKLYLTDNPGPTLYLEKAVRRHWWENKPRESGWNDPGAKFRGVKRDKDPGKAEKVLPVGTVVTIPGKRGKRFVVYNSGTRQNGDVFHRMKALSGGIKGSAYPNDYLGALDTPDDQRVIFSGPNANKFERDLRFSLELHYGEELGLKGADYDTKRSILNDLISKWRDGTGKGIPSKSEKLFSDEEEEPDAFREAHEDLAADRYKEAQEIMAKLPGGNIQTGPRGGRYIEGPGGNKHYIGNTTTTGPAGASYEYTKSLGPVLYLDLEKGNPHRDPSVGQFISGGTGKAMSGKGQEDLSEVVESLMDVMPGEDLKKETKKSVDLYLAVN